MTTRDGNVREETQIRELIDGWAKALRAKDVAGVVSCYTPDVLAFDLAPPLQHQGTAVRKGLEDWFPSFVGPIGFEMRDLSITAGEAVAFSHSLNHISGKRTSGESTDIWVRSTVCFRKIDGRWLVTHEHASVPFYMDGSMRASVDLKP